VSPLISVIIPNYNRTLILQRAVRSALAQTHQQLEVIVVDDCSPTNPQPFLDELNDNRIRLIRHKQNQHAAAARNTGAEAAKGRFLAFLDSDDEWLPEHLRLRLEQMQQHPECQGIYGGVQIIRDGVKAEKPKVRQIQPRQSMLDYLLSGRCKAQTSTLFFRKEAFDQVRFDPALFQHQDYDINIRFFEKFPDAYHCLPKATVKLHISSSAPSITKNIHHPSCLAVVKIHSQEVSFNNLLRYSLNMAGEALKNPKDRNYAQRYLHLLLNNQTNRTPLNQLFTHIWKTFDEQGLKFLIKIRPYDLWLQRKINSLKRRIYG
jgi:glycosyltransferase involved in cell wall biosynthesis